jgi:hypothetical protein
MQEVAEDFENLEKDAAAVLGNADMDNCTYFSGGAYMISRVLSSRTTFKVKFPF